MISLDSWNEEGRESVPGSTRFLRVEVAVALELITKRFAFSNAVCPADAHNRSCRSYFCVCCEGLEEEEEEVGSG